MTRLQLREGVVVAAMITGVLAGMAGAWAATASHRDARPAVTRPAPAPNPSPVLTSTHGGAR